MAKKDDSGDVIIQRMGDRYVRKHQNELESLSVTSGTYYILYADSRKVYDRTNMSINLRDKSIKNSDTLELFLFDTNPFPTTIDFELMTKDQMKVSGKIHYTVHLDNRKIVSAEGLVSKNDDKGREEITKGDIRANISGLIRDSVQKKMGRYDAQSISDDDGTITIKCRSIPQSVSKWPSEHGFVVSVDEIIVEYNELDKNKLDKKKAEDEARRRQEEIQKQKDELTKLQIKREVDKQKAILEIEADSGDSREIMEFKEMYSKMLLHGSFDIEDLYKAGKFVVMIGSGRCCLMYMDNTDEAIEFPSRVKKDEEYLAVTDIGPGVFKKPKSVKSVTLPEGIVNLDEIAFQNCTNLEEVTLPDSLTAIGARAFCNCCNLRKISIPDGVKDIDSRAFEGCKLDEIVINGELDISDVVLPRLVKVVRR